MIPNKKQWQQWTLPSKYTTVGLIIGVLSLLIGLAPWFSRDNLSAKEVNVKEEIKKAVAEIQQDLKKEDKYVTRYLKNRIAEIERAEFSEYNDDISAKIYYHSYWEKLTSSFLASIEIRHITELNKQYGEEEKWEKAKLVRPTNDYAHALYLGESPSLEVRNFSKGEIYEIRIVDFNYDSDEPPSLPFRFKVL